MVYTVVQANGDINISTYISLISTFFGITISIITAICMKKNSFIDDNEFINCIKTVGLNKETHPEYVR
jgi:hypothetical protein